MMNLFFESSRIFGSQCPQRWRCGMSKRKTDLIERRLHR